MDPATQQVLIEAAKYIIVAIISGVVSPSILAKVKAKFSRTEARANKTNAEAAAIETASASKIVELSTSLLMPFQQQLTMVSARLASVEAEKEQLRIAYESVLKELTERRVAEGRLNAEIILIREENKNIREENAWLRSRIAGTPYEKGKGNS